MTAPVDQEETVDGWTPSAAASFAWEMPDAFSLRRNSTAARRRVAASASRSRFGRVAGSFGMGGWYSVPPKAGTAKPSGNRNSCRCVSVRREIEFGAAGRLMKPSSRDRVPVLRRSSDPIPVRVCRWWPTSAFERHEPRRRTSYSPAPAHQPQPARNPGRRSPGPCRRSGSAP